MRKVLGPPITAMVKDMPPRKEPRNERAQIAALPLTSFADKEAVSRFRFRQSH